MTQEIAIALVGFCFLIIGIHKSKKSSDLKNNGIKVEGVIYSLEQDRRSGIYYPVVRFRTKENRWITKKLNFGTNPPQYAEGEKVSVLYDPDDPENVDFDSSFNLTVAPALFIIIGLVCWVYDILYLFDFIG